MKKLEGKVALITGSSRGIGKATALLFAQRGAYIVINYISSKKLAVDLEKEIEAMGSKAISIKCDVSREEEVKNMVDEAIKVFGKIDILVNNAGVAIDSPLFERTVNQWNQTLNTNLLGVYLCSKYASKYMLLNKEGKIINISSTSAIYSYSPDIIDYDASKAGVIALTKNFAKALAPKIQVNAIAPGWVDTDINKDLPKDFVKHETQSIYLKRFAQPEEIAKAILFLASNDASFITGSVLVVDGGHD